MTTESLTDLVDELAERIVEQFDMLHERASELEQEAPYGATDLDDYSDGETLSEDVLFCQARGWILGVGEALHVPVTDLADLARARTRRNLPGVYDGTYVENRCDCGEFMSECVCEGASE